MRSELVAYNLSLADDFNAYLEIWRSAESRRPHDHPQYMELMKVGKQEPHAFVYFEDGVAKIVYPFYLVRLKDYTGFQPTLDFNHIVSAYGYGGPAFLSNAAIKIDAFEELLEKYFRDNKIISEFVREDLFNDYKVPRNFSGIKQQDNVVVDLTRSSDILWKEYKHAVRKNVNRAIASNLSFFLDFDGALVDDFVNVYHATMKRTGANEAFLISADMFKKFNRFLKDGIGFYAHVLLDEKVIATELVLRSPRYLYSFLGGANFDFYHLRPSDYLKHKVNLWAIENRYCGYVLGGGFKPYDGIYKFKLAFDQRGATPFFIQKNIHDQAAYQKTVESRKNFERLANIDWNPSDDFFPAFLQGIAI